MFVKLILPALLEAKDPGFRPIKYALFPPLGWLPPPATVAHYRSKESGTAAQQR